MGAKKGCRKNCKCKKLILNVQAYATVKDVVGNAFEGRMMK